MGTEYRLAQQYDTAYLGYRHTWRFLVEEVLNDSVAPLVLTDFDAVKLQTYLTSASASLIDDLTCTVLDNATDHENSVAARCQIQWTPATDSYTAGTTYIARLVGYTTSGAITEILEKPWQFEAFAAGPTS